MRHTAEEIIHNGVCMQEKIVNDRCAVCNDKLILAVYKFDGKKLKKVIRCKKCNTATRLD